MPTITENQNIGLNMQLEEYHKDESYKLLEK